MRAGTLCINASLCLLFLSTLAHGGDMVEAAKNGDLEVVRSILAKDPSAVHATDESKYTALHWAAMRARWDVADLLLEHAPDVNAIGEDGGSPLNWAAHHDNVEFIRKMLDKGADANARNQWGMTSLHTAAWRGCVNIARLMLDRGADPEIRTNEGWTVLHMAYRSGHQEVIDLLLARGARTDVKDNEGRTPRELQFHKPRAVEMKPSELNEYVGTYRYKDTSFTIDIWREGSQMHLMEYGPDLIYPAKKDLFYCVQAPWTLTFSRDEGGSVTKVHLQFIRKGYDMIREPESLPVNPVEGILEAFDRFPPEGPPMDGFMGDYFRGNIVRQLERLHPGSIFSIKTLTSTDRLESRYPRVASWPRPSLVRLEATGVGALTVQGEHALATQYDALLWLGPSSTISYSEPLPESVSDEAYFNEALRRDRLWIGQYQELLPELRQKYLQE